MLYLLYYHSVMQLVVRNALRCCLQIVHIQSIYLLHLLQSLLSSFFSFCDYVNLNVLVIDGSRLDVHILSACELLFATLYIQVKNIVQQTALMSSITVIPLALCVLRINVQHLCFLFYAGRTSSSQTEQKLLPVSKRGTVAWKWLCTTKSLTQGPSMCHQTLSQQ